MLTALAKKRLSAALFEAWLDLASKMPCCQLRCRLGAAQRDDRGRSHRAAAGEERAAIGQESADRRGTITLLLHYSSYDLPLLLLAFFAGELPIAWCSPELQCVCNARAW